MAKNSFVAKITFGNPFIAIIVYFFFYVKHLQPLKHKKLQSPGIYLFHMPGLICYFEKDNSRNVNTKWW